MSVMDKLKKNSKLKHTEVLSESKFFNDKDMTSTSVPMVNVALSGSIDGGLSPGLTVLQSLVLLRHTLSNLVLIQVVSFILQSPMSKN